MATAGAAQLADGPGLPDAWGQPSAYAGAERSLRRLPCSLVWPRRLVLPRWGRGGRRHQMGRAPIPQERGHGARECCGAVGAADGGQADALCECVVFELFRSFSESSLARDRDALGAAVGVRTLPAPHAALNGAPEALPIVHCLIARRQEVIEHEGHYWILLRSYDSFVRAILR